MDPFFTIITPVKNGKFFIDRYLNSLFNQTFKNFEGVLVDDFSNDNSYEILNSKIIDGALVGGASLDVDKFIKIIESVDL